MKLFKNGKIWQWLTTPTTFHVESKEFNGPNYTFSSWMIVKENIIVDIGIGSAPVEIASQCEEQIDLQGQLVLPGLHDSHLHIFGMGEAASMVQLNGCKSLAELKDRVQKYSKENPLCKWIVGFGWEQDELSHEGTYPTSLDLDDAVSDRPVFLWRACWHIAVANTKAMQIAGIDLNSPLQRFDGGIIDVIDGKPNGIFREKATELIEKQVTESSDAVQTNDHDCWRLYQELQDQGELPIRVYLTPDIEEVGNNIIPPAGFNDRLLSCDRVKIFADGSLGAETAALRTPYCNSSNQGVLLHSNDEMVNKIIKGHQNGYRLEIHAIGDRAAIQVVESLQVAGVENSARPVLTHCQVLGADIIEKMNNNGIIANIQPSFIVTDANWAVKRLEKSLQPFSYCWRSLMKKGVVCAGGSDAPIETCNPFQGIYDAMFRAKKSEEVYLPHEKLTFEEALCLYTMNGAFAAKAEHHLGNLEKGFLADFVIVDELILTMPERMLEGSCVREVWVNGLLQFKNASEVKMQMSTVAGNFVHGRNGKIRLCRCCR